MTPREFYEQLATVQESEMFALSPGPFEVIVVPADAWAAKLMLWLVENLPEGTTQGDVEEIIDTAKWWSQYWNMLLQTEKAKQRKREEATQVEPSL